MIANLKMEGRKYEVVRNQVPENCTEEHYLSNLNLKGFISSLVVQNFDKNILILTTNEYQFQILFFSLVDFQ